MSAGWTGGFLLPATGRDGLEVVPEPVGVSAFATPRGPGWAKDGNFADPRPPAPEDTKGKPVRMPAAMKVKKNGIEVKFTDALDEASANDLQNYSLEQWNYKWTKNYGSPEFSVTDPDKKGHDRVEVKSARLAADHKTVFLEITEFKPVMQM